VIPYLKMRSRTSRWIVVCLAVCILFSYVLPTLVERLLVSRIGPFWAYVVLGDVMGCAVLGALTRWRIGIALYLVLDVVETLLLQTRVVSVTGMMWMADAVPTALLCLLAIMVVRVRGGWRLDLDA
jgi:hypothetical protein